MTLKPSQTAHPELALGLKPLQVLTPGELHGLLGPAPTRSATTTATAVGFDDLAADPDSIPTRAARKAAAKKRPGNANLGKSWEASLVEQHRFYLSIGWADIDRVPAPAMQLGEMRYERGRPVFTASWGRSRMPDFVGPIAVGKSPGRCARLEAKSSRTNAVELYQAVDTEGKGHGAGLQANQAASLQRCVDAGGFAAVLVLLPAGMWLVRFQDWGPPPGTSKKSLNPKQLDALGLRFGGVAEAARVLQGFTAQADWLGPALTRGWL